MSYEITTTAIEDTQSLCENRRYLCDVTCACVPDTVTAFTRNSSVESNAVHHPPVSPHSASNFDVEPQQNRRGVRSRQTLSANASPLHVCAKGSPVSRRQLLQHGLASSASASSFFRRAFSTSSSFSRFAFSTFIPPYMLFQR